MDSNSPLPPPSLPSLRSLPTYQDLFVRGRHARIILNNPNEVADDLANLKLNTQQINRELSDLEIQIWHATRDIQIIDRLMMIRMIVFSLLSAFRRVRLLKTMEFLKAWAQRHVLLVRRNKVAEQLLIERVLDSWS